LQIASKSPPPPEYSPPKADYSKAKAEKKAKAEEELQAMVLLEFKDGKKPVSPPGSEEAKKKRRPKKEVKIVQTTIETVGNFDSLGGRLDSSSTMRYSLAHPAYTPNMPRYMPILIPDSF